jgi:hypothetical protein
VDKLDNMVSAAAPIFYHAVELYITLAIMVVLVVIEVIAIVNCASQRADAFPVVGSLTKTAWLAILGGSVILSVICTYSGAPYFAFIAVAAAGVYMLDVRPALRDATDGTGSW